MQQQTVDYLDQWWAERFSIGPTALWRSFTAMPHGLSGDHDPARWGARNTDVASLATARRLGFEPWCTQLAIR